METFLMDLLWHAKSYMISNCGGSCLCSYPGSDGTTTSNHQEAQVLPAYHGLVGPDFGTHLT
jgi:hypothetical protein